MHIGFSTGSIAFGNFRGALKLLHEQKTDAVELSALREEELIPLMEAIDDLNLEKFKYISVHAPSKLRYMSEAELIAQLMQLSSRKWPIVVHPDIITDFSLWKQVGTGLCIENMDKRKPIGRTVTDLEYLFDKLPDAQFCLDVAHARQVDPTMLQCYLMLQSFSSRLVQIHLSDVTSDSKHVPLNLNALHAYNEIIGDIDPNIPVILESPITDGPHHQERIAKELRIAADLFRMEFV